MLSTVCTYLRHLINVCHWEKHCRAEENIYIPSVIIIMIFTKKKNKKITCGGSTIKQMYPFLYCNSCERWNIESVENAEN